MTYIRTQTHELSPKFPGMKGLLRFIRNPIARLTVRKSRNPKMVQVSEQHLKTLGQMQRGSERPYATPLSVDVATQLAMRANGHLMRR